jgi:hypothetical protein
MAAHKMFNIRRPDENLIAASVIKIMFWGECSGSNKKFVHATKNK